jgi:hypothetical protein
MTSYGMSPTVRCPGCTQAIEIDHQVHRTLDGNKLYVPIQSETSALAEHMDECPNVERGEQ